jgi:molybdopterin converting factor small subunit
MTAVLAIGTRKGLWLATSEDGRRTWEVTGPRHPMTDVYAVGFDTRRPAPRLLAGVTSEHYGPSVSYSDDLGQTWHEPDHAPIAFPADTGAALGRVWQFAPGSEPDVTCCACGRWWCDVHVTVRLPAALRQRADDRSSVDVDLPEDATLADVLDVLAERYPGLERRLRDEGGRLRRYVNFYVDGEECRHLDGARTPLRDAVEVRIIPSVAGG